MSHWDFSRQPDMEPDAPPPGPAGTACEPDPLLWADGPWSGQDVRRAGPAQPARDPGPADDEAAGPLWPADSSWPSGGHWPDNEGWPPRLDGFPGTERPYRDARDDDAQDDDAWDDDGTAPYPVTYERDELLAAAPQPAPPPAAAWEPWPGPSPDASRPSGRRDPASRAGDAPAASPGWPAAEPTAPGEAPAGWDDWGRDGGGRARRGGRRRLVLAGVAVACGAAGAAAVLLAGRAPAGHAAPGTRPASAPSAPPAQRTPRAGASGAPSSPVAAATGAPLTLAQAQAVLARYTTVNNSANARRSDALLATIETGSSYAIDAGLYQSQQGTAPYPAFGPVRAAYYIPRGEPAAGPRWFAVQVANAFSSAPQKVTSGEYLLFTQPAPGGPWLDAAEPYLLPGTDAPRIAVGADGLATAVSLDAASVAVAPSQLPAATAASADGTAAGAGAGRAAVTVPWNLADLGDQRLWQGKVDGGTVTDAHSPAAGTAGQEFALRTADGGALVFYTDAAQVTVTPPAGTTLRLSVPGFYSPAQALSQASVSYLEQFAAYDPPAGGGTAPAVVADYSGIAGRS